MPIRTPQNNYKVNFSAEGLLLALGCALLHGFCWYMGWSESVIDTFWIACGLSFVALILYIIYVRIFNPEED